MAKPAAQRVLSRLDDLPPLPRNTMRLGEIIEDPASTPLQLAQVIEQDAALAARVMRLANSAYCAVSSGVDNLERAVCLLGFSTIHHIALCLQSLQILGSQGPPPPEQLMEHSLQVACASQLLAERLKLPLPQRFFAAGLLHDIGRLALYVLEPEQAHNWPERAEQEPDRLLAERQLFGIDHLEAGRLLAGKWKYPRALLGAIANHHPGLDGEGTEPAVADRQLQQVVCVADNWLRQLDRSSLPGVEFAPRTKPAVVLGLPGEPDEQFVLSLDIRLAEDTPAWG
ncbi:MAG: hypothetical protein DRI34_09895 [Deltaproteobacteria bacterium]|nr:MAG: hypothetical protein DRI34_09895 [Deltaproteobacteria bacterium]